MKRTLSILLVLTITACCFASCSSGSNSETTPTSTTTATTENSLPSNASVFDYLPEPKETVSLLKEYFKNHGYSFADWYCAQDDSEAYIELASVENKGIALNFKTNGYAFNLGNTKAGPNAVMWYTGTNVKVDIFVTTKYGDAFEVLDILLSNCPDEIKPSMSELKKVKDLPSNSAGASSYLDIETAGTYYRLNYLKSGDEINYCISFYKSEPGGWNG